MKKKAHPARLLVMWMTLLGGCAQAGGPAMTPLTLSSGRTIKVMAVGPLSGPFGHALMLSYQTDLKVSDMANLQKEATEIWADFRSEVEKAKMDVAVVAANEAPTGTFFTSNSGYRFVFERKPDIGWTDVRAKIDGGHVVRHGLYDRNATTVAAAPETAAGKTRMARRMPRWLGAPAEIARTKGTFFGYEFVVDGQPVGSAADVKIVVDHPPYRRPGSAETSARETWTQMVVLGSPSFGGYGFDEDWERVAGKWNVAVYYGTRQLCQKEFSVK